MFETFDLFYIFLLVVYMASQLDNDHNVISVIPFLSLKSDKRDLENIKVDGFIVLHLIHGY